MTPNSGYVVNGCLVTKGLPGQVTRGSGLLTVEVQALNSQKPFKHFKILNLLIFFKYNKWGGEARRGDGFQKMQFFKTMCNWKAL